MTSEIFREHFRYYNPSALAKDIVKASKVRNNQIVHDAIYPINELRNAVIKKNSLKIKIQIK